VYGWREIKKAVVLFDHGVEVIGAVTGLGALGNEAWAVLKYEYVYNGTKYSGSFDMDRSEATKLRDRGEVRLLVNQNNPRQSCVFELVAPTWTPLFPAAHSAPNCLHCVAKAADRL
jgi:hypothetical protein